MTDTNGWWFADLLFVIVFAGLAVAGIHLGVRGAARIGLAMPLLLLLPGYAIVALTFPEDAPTDDGSFDDDRTGLWNPGVKRYGIDRTVRFVLSIVLSVAVVPVVALAANLAAGEIALRPLLVGLGLVAVTGSLLALLRRLRLPAERRFAPTVGAFWSGLFYSRSGGRIGRSGAGTAAYNVAIGVSLLLLVSSVGYAVVNPPQHDGFTELYVDTGPVTGDDQSMYRTTYVRGERQSFAVNVTNREHREVRYTTLVLLQRVTDGDGEPTVRDETELARDSVTVADGATERQAFDIAPTMSGDDLRLVVLLYRGDAPADPTTGNAYKVLRLPITVEGANSLSPPGADGSRSSAALASGGR